MAAKYSVAAINAQLDALDDQVNGGAGAALLRIYNGTRPATPDTAITSQTLLAELPMSDPAFGAAASGVLTAGAITTDASANATGTATWFRIVTSAGTAVIDGDVGTSGTELILNTVSIVTGGPVAVSSLVITGGND